MQILIRVLVQINLLDTRKRPNQLDPDFYLHYRTLVIVKIVVPGYHQSVVASRIEAGREMVARIALTNQRAVDSVEHLSLAPTLTGGRIEAEIEFATSVLSWRLGARVLLQY